MNDAFRAPLITSLLSTSYKLSGDTDSYNGLVDRQNQLVKDYNTQYTECESDRLHYDQTIGQ